MISSRNGSSASAISVSSKVPHCGQVKFRSITCSPAVYGPPMSRIGPSRKWTKSEFFCSHSISRKHSTASPVERDRALGQTPATLEFNDTDDPRSSNHEVSSLRYLLPTLSVAGATLAQPYSVSTSRSSNRLPVLRSIPCRHAVAHHPDEANRTGKVFSPFGDRRSSQVVALVPRLFDN